VALKAFEEEGSGRQVMMGTESVTPLKKEYLLLK
jgi:hypothetical protein